MSQPLQQATRGNEVTLTLQEPERQVTFVAGGEMRVELYPENAGCSTGIELSLGVFDKNPVFVMANGQLQFADGQLAWAILVICETECAELWDWGVFTADNGCIFASDFLPADGCGLTDWPIKTPLGDNGDAFLNLLGKSRGDIWPLRYKYDAILNVDYDHHVDSSGWYSTSYDAYIEAAAARLAEILPLSNFLREIIAASADTPIQLSDFPLKGARERILRILAKRPQYCFALVDLSVSKKTAGKIANELINKGLARRPNGKAGGLQITAAGLKLAKQANLVG